MRGEACRRKVVRIGLVISAALLESQGTVSETTSDVRDRFPVEASSDAPIKSAGGSFDQA